MFIDLNVGQWQPDPPNVDDAEQAMLAIAAHKLTETEFADWLRTRIQFYD